MGKYIVGFDTISYYVPVTLRLINSRASFLEFVGYAPLFYVVLMQLTLSGVPLVVSLKVLPSVLIGFLSLSIFVYAQRALGWSNKKSLSVSLLATLYFVGLRISWDMLRSMLGLIFLFIFLTILSRDLSRKSSRRFGLLLLTMVLVVISNQLTAVLMFVILSAFILHGFLKHEYLNGLSLFVCSLPALFIFGLTAYADFIALPSNSVSNAEWLSLFAFSSPVETFLVTLGFLLFCYSPLLPLVLRGMKRSATLELKVWFFWCLAAGLGWIIVPYVFVLGYRWILLLLFPMAFFAVDAFKWVKSSVLKKAFCGLLILLSLSFIFLPAEAAFPYFEAFPYYVPSSMLQNSVPLSDVGNVETTLSWVKHNIGSDGVLLVHDAFYGWALLFLDANRVVCYGYGLPEEAAQVAFGNGYRRVFVIWWVSGEGWHGVTALSSCFVEVLRSGRIAVYEYRAA
jgi:hypothetical protein